MKNRNGLTRNISLYYAFQVARASLFFLAIWVVYQELFLSFEQIAYFGSLSWIIIIIFELPTGVLADLISRRFSVSLGSLIAGLGFLALVWPSYWMMYVYSFLFGIGTSMISGSNNAILYDTLKELDREKDYPKISANANFIFQITAVVAILVGGYLYNLNIKIPYFLRGITLILGSIIPLFMKEPHIDTYKFSLKEYIKQTKEGIREAFKTKYLGKLSLLFILVAGIGMANHRFFSQKYMVEIDLDTITRSWLSSAIKLIVASITIFLANRKKLFNSKYFLLFLPILMVVFTIPIGYISYPLASLFILGIAVPSGAHQIFIGYHLNKSFQSKYRATVLSALNLASSILYSIAVYAGGLLVASHTVGIYYMVVGFVFLLFVIPLTLNIVLKSK